MNMTMPMTGMPSMTGATMHTAMNMSMGSFNCSQMLMSMMNCSNMNMAGMNMSGNGMNMGGLNMMMMMPMFFDVGKDVTILFKNWKTDTVGGLIGSLIALFVIAFMYEGIKIFREELKKREFKSLGIGQGYDMSVKNGGASNGKDGCHEPKFFMNTSRILSKLHILQTFLHMFQVFVGYLLMLAVMTFNVWIFIAVVLGAGAGYFAFGWRRVSIVDVGDHCL